MSSNMSLNTRVHIVGKLGKKEAITVRDLLARGTGSSFECFKMLDEYEQLAEAYKAEVAAAAAEEDRKDHLPHGAHLLPQDYQDFLYSWNKTIATTPGCRWWNGLGRDIYKGTNKEAWAKWVAQNKEFRKRYTSEVEQLIAYQSANPIQDEDSDDEMHSLNMDPFPSLPPSPIALDEQPDTDGEDEAETGEQPDLSEELCSSCNYRNITGHARCHMCGHTPLPEAEGPKRTRNPIYTNYKWPSPLAKVFVQEIRGGNAWNYSYKGRDPWPVSFRYVWTESGNTEFRLTHDNCMRYLARRMSLSLEQLMATDPRDVHAKLIGTRHGVKGYYTRYW